MYEGRGARGRHAWGRTGKGRPERGSKVAGPARDRDRAVRTATTRGRSRSRGTQRRTAPDAETDDAGPRGGQRKLGQPQANSKVQEVRLLRQHGAEVRRRRSGGAPHRLGGARC